MTDTPLTILKRKVRQFGAFNIDVTDELRKSMAQRAQPMT